jgi:nifR3 family TIM-barrel protein
VLSNKILSWRAAAIALELRSFSARAHGDKNISLSMHIGPHHLNNNLVVAPMAGVTDRPFRQLCKRLGAGMAVSEMVASDPRLRATHKSTRRADHRGEVDPISVQILGADPQLMAQAAKHNVEQGAQIIDINMGCPAKKVCNVAAGSALMKDEELVRRILDAVVGAVDVPVTLKIRTGWDQQHRNAVRVARIAQSAGVRALAVHGRTRACGFTGEAEYATIAAVKSQVSIPVIANGDIDSPEKAKTRAELGLNPADFMTRITSLRDYKPQALQILMGEGVVASTEEGKLYLVEEKCREFLEKRL